MSERVYHTVTTVEEQAAMLAFAQEAGKVFAKNPNLTTYGSVERGSFLAIRHGLMERDVKVVKLDDTFVPFVFAGMTVRYTQQGCKVETIYTIQSNGTYTESVELSVDPASALSLAVEERASQAVAIPAAVKSDRMRVRSTRFGFQLVDERS